MKAVAANSIAGAMLAFLSTSAGADTAIPDNLKAAPTQTLAVVAKAVGVQIYECSSSTADPARVEWAFKSPEAELFDHTGKKMGKHYAGPTWESDDGSKVAGEVKARDDGPDGSAIPWLLLSAKSVEGNGIFGKTQSVQRVETAGGKAPADGCDRGNLGKIVRVPYRATYNFYISGYSVGAAPPAGATGSPAYYFR